MKDLVVFGTRQIAEVCAFYFEHDSEYRVAAYTVDGAFLTGDQFRGRPVIPFEEVARRFPPSEHDMFVAIGYGKMNRLRAKKFAEAKTLGYRLARYVSTKAFTWPGLTIGENTFVMEANVIQPYSSIGADTILWSGNHIGHHARIGDHCFIASHVVVSGNVEIGDHCFVGVNVTLRDGIKVAPRCLIGAGALITKDTKPDEVYAATAAEPSRVPSSRVSP
jgi:sugar O-acyltransferase (sialic acid O-acetyltransferase NeuD family)